MLTHVSMISVVFHQIDITDEFDTMIPDGGINAWL